MSKKNMSRRDFLRASALAASGAALAGAVPAFAAPPAQDGATIRYWVFWNQYATPAEEFLPKLNEAVAPNTVELTTGVGINDAFLTAAESFRTR